LSIFADHPALLLSRSFGVLLIGIPLQAFLFSVMIGTRKAQMKITDDRVRLLQEVLQGIRVISELSCLQLLAIETVGANT
jgi:hypothetical protein